MRRWLVAGLASAAAIGAVGLARGDFVRTLTGSAAYGDWRIDAPGLRFRITPADLPPPNASPSTANPAREVARPKGALPKAPFGFAVDIIAKDLGQPRVMRAAPNGDVFVAESGAGRVLVLRGADDAKTPADVSVFAASLDRPYGIAFYPPGPEPKFVYVATPTQVYRFPYKSGDMVSSGPPEKIVSLPDGGGHWTRDLAVAADGSTLYASVGSLSNAAEDMKPLAGLEAFRKTHALGAGWGPEAGRADVLAFKPDGSGLRVFATGLRNCSGLSVQPDSSALWCVVNERDGLGDDLPPDYATTIGDGKFYGWPWYYIGDHEDPQRGKERPDHRARRAAAAAFRAARHRLLQFLALSREIPRRRLRRHARLLEPRQAHRLQGGAAGVRQRPSDRGIRGFPHRLRRRRRRRLGPPLRRLRHQGRRPAGERRPRRRDLAGEIRGGLGCSAPPTAPYLTLLDLNPEGEAMRMRKDVQAEAAIRQAIEGMFGDSVERIVIGPTEGPDGESAFFATVYMKAGQESVSAQQLLDAIGAASEALRELDDYRFPYVTFLAPEDERAEA